MQKPVAAAYICWQTRRMAFTPQTVLVYTDGEVIGDGIIRLPFAAAVKQAFPGIRITWLASGYSVYENALADLAKPLIDELIIIPHRKLPFSDFLFGPEPVRGKVFDLVIDTQRKVKRTLWLKRIRHKKFVSAAANYLLSDGKAETRPRFIDQICALFEAATGTRLALSAITLPCDDWANAAKQVLPDGKTYVGFIVGAGHPDKCWPLERFIALAKRQELLGHVPVIFLGPKEQAEAARIRAELPNAILPLSADASCDTKNPCYTIALGNRLSGAIANDSGGGHLLAAGGSKLVSLFRSSTVRKKFMPTAPRVIALAPEDFGGSQMADIPQEAAATALRELLAAP
jgi:ADP-heptose:LPS heptosyltransferase